MKLFMKQTQTHRHGKQIYSYQRGKRKEGINSVWYWQIKTTIHKIDKQ